MAIYNYFTEVRALTCEDAVNGLYKVKYFVKNAATSGASNVFWHEGMTTPTPLTVAPADNVIPAVSIQGKTADELIEATKQRAQGLADRLTKANVTPITVTAGFTFPSVVEY